MKKLTGVLISVFMVLTLVACGSSPSKSASYDTEMASVVNSKSASSVAAEPGFYEEASGEYYEESGSTGDNTTLNDSARKLIKTYSINAETEIFDDFVAATEARINALQGYIQNMDSFNGSNYNGKKGSRYCNLTVRVPAKRLDEFVNFIGEAANVTNKNLNVEDITLQYVDTESRKKTYEIQRDRLNALLEKAETAEDMTTIINSISEVEYRLESQASQLRTFDNLVDYATVYLNISEVSKYTPPEPEKYWDRVKRSFSEGIENVVEGLQNFFVGFVGALPGLVVFAVIVVIIVLVVRVILKAGNKKREAKREKRAEDLMNQAKETAKKNAEDRQ